MFTPIPRDLLTGSRWLAALNSSGEELPAHAVVIVQSLNDSGQFVVSKPTQDGQHAWIAGDIPVADGGGTSALNEFPTWAKYDSADGTPAVGETWGAGAGSWKLRKGKAGFRICGTANAAAGIVPVERAVGLSADRSDPACKSFLSLPECATLEVTEAYGACECITTGQTASLTRSGAALASDDLLYGCPPGVTTATNCTDGEAAAKFNFTLTTQPGACAGAGGNWTVTYSALNTWTATKSGFTATLTKASGSSAELTITDGSETITYVGTFDCCTGGTLDIDSWSGDCDPPATLTLTPATACGNGPAYTPYLTAENDTCGPCLKLLWIPVAGSGAASVRWRMTGCGVDANGRRYAEFASDSPLICTDDAEECGENYVVVRVTCVPCGDAVFRNFVALPCGSACTNDCGDELDVLTMPETICVAAALTAGTDCAGFDGLQQQATLVAGPIGSPIETGYVGDANWLTAIAFIRLVDGAIVDDSQQDQCASWIILENLPYLTTGGVFSFNGGTGFTGFTLQWQDGGWKLIHSGTTFSPTATDPDGCTVTFDVSGNATAAAAFGSTSSALVFYVSGTPKYTYEARYVWGEDAGYPLYVVTTVQVNGDCSATYSIVRMEEGYGGVAGSSISGTLVAESPYAWAMCSLAAEESFTLEDQGYGGIGSCNASTNPTTKYEVNITPNAESCEAAPTPITYNCVDGTCVEVYDGSGTYATEAECEEVCTGSGGGGGCAVEPGDTATLHIEDGGYAGDYNATWNPFGPIQLKASFVIPSLGSSVSVVIPYPAVASTDESYMTVFLNDYFGEITCDPFLGTYDDSTLLLELDTTLPVTVD